MTELLWAKWYGIKDHIEKLKPYGNDAHVQVKIRLLKNEASVLKFAIEDIGTGLISSEAVLIRMRENRESYKRI